MLSKAVLNIEHYESLVTVEITVSQWSYVRPELDPWQYILSYTSKQTPQM